MGRRLEPEEKDYCADAQRYAEQVVAGKLPACQQVIDACRRQLSDLGRPYGTDWPWKFDRERASSVCTFIELLPHVKGRWKSVNIELEPWQCFIVTTIFGWIDDEGFRRFRTAYIEVPRKNAKTTLCAGLALYMLCADGEPGAEVYSAAVTKDQARISWEIAQAQVKRESEMRKFYGVEPLAHSIVIEQTGSFFKPLARDADSLEGLSPHCAIIDEVHAHKTREVWDVLNVARGSRRQSLLFAITTAGDNKVGVCYEQHGYVEQILGGRHRDDRYFGIIYTLDAHEDWTTIEAARKANPNFGVSVLPDDIDMMSRQAQANAQAQNTFLTKRMNVWVSVGTAYFNMLAWDTICKEDGITVEQFHGEPCIIGMDLATKKDLAAKMIVFKRGGNFYVFGRYYLPSDAIAAGNPNYDFYRGWEKQGLLTVTEGNVTDYDYIERDLLSDMATLRPIHVGVDPNYNAGQLTTRMLSAGVPMIEVPQNVMTFSEPMKTLDALIVAGRIKHCGDPVLQWAIGNVVARVDVKGNVYPRKEHEANKIDPAVALMSALSLHLKIGEQWDYRVVAI